MEKDADEEAAKWKATVLHQEQDERREALKKGIRMHPQLKLLDALAMNLQMEEEDHKTKYVDWRNDLLEAVRLSPITFFLYTWAALQLVRMSADSLARNGAFADAFDFAGMRAFVSCLGLSSDSLEQFCE